MVIITLLSNTDLYFPSQTSGIGCRDGARDELHFWSDPGQPFLRSVDVVEPAAANSSSRNQWACEILGIQAHR